MRRLVGLAALLGLLGVIFGSLSSASLEALLRALELVSRIR